MAYSVYWGTTDISNYVTDCPPIPLVSTTHDNTITLPSMSIQVVNNANAYAVGDHIYFKDGNNTFAWFDIENISEDVAAHTKTLELVDALQALENLYVADLDNDDFYAACILTSEDFDLGGICKRYGWSESSEAPYRVHYVTLTHMIKTALVKAGLATAVNIDASDLYGTVDSGFIRWDYDNDVDKVLYKEELCYQIDQIKYAKKHDGTEEFYDGATLLEMVLYSLQVLNAYIYYYGGKIYIKNRDTDADPADDDIYAYKADTWLNAFDFIRCNIYYCVTCSNLTGFANYHNGALGSYSVSDESWPYPTLSGDAKPKERQYTLMDHAVVHYRKKIETHYYAYEMHLEANELGSPALLDYLFAKQYAEILYNRFPTSGAIETWETVPDVTTRGPRPLLNASLDIPNRKFTMEC